MSSTSELSSFAARLRRRIGASPKDPERAWAERPSFEQLALDLFALQFELNTPYRRFCETRGARPGSVAHWTAIPAVPTSAFKEWALSCLPVAERTEVFHSSGTTGRRSSRHFHGAESLAVYEASLLAWFNAHFQWPVAKGQLAILAPPPAQAPHSSLVHMFEAVRREFGWSGSVFFGSVAEDGGWTLELEAVLQFLQEANATGQPRLMLGTAFSFVHLLDHLADRGLSFELPSGSCVLETGGYKGRSRVLPQAALHALISQRLGVPPDHIVCEYGMSELSSQAYDCAVSLSRNTHHAPRTFRFPPWARVQIISPETGREVNEGETGLIRVFDLANVYSVMAVQTEDLGVRHGDGFALVGRAALAEPRGCSLLAV